MVLFDKIIPTPGLLACFFHNFNKVINNETTTAELTWQQTHLHDNWAHSILMKTILTSLDHRNNISHLKNKTNLTPTGLTAALRQWHKMTKVQYVYWVSTIFKYLLPFSAALNILPTFQR